MCLSGGEWPLWGALWCVYTHKKNGIMSTHLSIVSKALVPRLHVEACVVVGSCLLLVSPRSRSSLLLFLLCCLLVSLAVGVALLWLSCAVARVSLRCCAGVGLGLLALLWFSCAAARVSFRCWFGGDLGTPRRWGSDPVVEALVGVAVSFCG